MRTPDQIQGAMIAYLKSQPTVTSLLVTGTSTEIRESQWQGDQFLYPAIRINVDFMPSINGCGPDKADFTIEVFSEEKSGKQVRAISGALALVLHKHPFTSNGLRFFLVAVQRVSKPERSIFAWQSTITVPTQVT